MKLLKEKILYIVAALAVAAIWKAGSEALDVSELKANTKSDHELIKETNENVKEIRVLFIQHLEK